LNKKSANSQISDYLSPIWVAPIKKVNNYENLDIDYEHFSFAEKNEYSPGLKNFLWIEKSDFPPIFIFDNHNHAPVFRYYCTEKSNKASPTLIHIDQHSDCRENKENLEL
jgi:arginase family enzyme